VDVYTYLINWLHEAKLRQGRTRLGGRRADRAHNARQVDDPHDTASLPSPASLGFTQVLHGISRDQPAVRVRHDDHILARVRQRSDLAVEKVCIVG